MPIIEQIELLFLFITLTFIFSSIGIGGGIFYVPILLFLGFSFNNASQMSLSIIFVMALAALPIYLKNKLIDFKLILIMEPFSAIGGLFGGYISEYSGNRFLFILFGSVMLIAALLLPFKKEKPAPSVSKKFSISRYFGEYSYSLNIPIAIFLGFLAGLLSGLLGIGGGTIKVPIMLIVFHIPMKIVVATSVAMILITSLAGFIGHLIQGHGNYSLLILLSIAAIIGGQLGSRFMVKINKKLINAILITAFLIIGVFMLYKGIFFY